jgi:hypothetical protein
MDLMGNFALLASIGDLCHTGGDSIP